VAVWEVEFPTAPADPANELVLRAIQEGAGTRSVAVSRLYHDPKGTHVDVLRVPHQAI
jgi:hypothetical protein